MLNWLRTRRESIRAFEALWAPEREVDAEGVSRFQRRAEFALAHNGFPLSGRQTETLSLGPPVEVAVSGVVGRFAAKVIVYQDALHLDVDGDYRRWEDWDAVTPDDLIALLVAALTELRTRAR